MIAALLQKFGVFMGKAVDGAVFEDREIAKLIDEENLEQLGRLVAERHATHKIWGWKRPNAYKQIGQLENLVRQPRVIVLFRDVLAIGMRNHISMQMDVIKTLPKLVEEYHVLVENISRLSCPTLLVSYEKFLQFPEDSIARVAAFAGVELDDSGMQEALAIVSNGPARYLNASRLRYTGHVDRIIDGKLRGWAMVEGRKEIKAKVSLFVAGRFVKSVIANTKRDDLLKKGIGDGQHGFTFEVDASIDRNGVVSVVAGNANTELTNSGKQLNQYEI